MFRGQGMDYFFNCHRPKTTNVLPTPMMLCDSLYDDQFKEPFITYLDYNSEGRMTQGTQGTDTLCRNDVSSLFNDIRKELSSIYSNNEFRSSSKNLESLINTENKMTMNDDRRFSTKKSNKRSIWRKYIEIEDMNYFQSRSVRYSLKNDYYPLLRILEAAAHDSTHKKV